MDDNREKLVEDLKRLRAELRQSGQDDDPVAARLDEILAGLQHEAGEEDVLDGLRSAIENFETGHPRATAILNDIMVTLSNMGI